MAIGVSLCLLPLLLFYCNNTPKFDLDELHAKAKIYANGDENLLEYIQNILEDNKFQTNPNRYLDNWKEKRGYTEEFRMPEDQARLFFDQHFKQK